MLLLIQSILHLIPLIKTLEKFVDFNKLKPTGQLNSRLIITAVNVLTAEPLIFDSSKQQITSKHILAATGYPTHILQMGRSGKRSMHIPKILRRYHIIYMKYNIDQETLCLVTKLFAIAQLSEQLML